MQSNFGEEESGLLKGADYRSELQVTDDFFVILREVVEVSFDEFVERRTDQVLKADGC